MAALDPDQYTVVWIAPLEIEAKAAIEMLDNRHHGHFPVSRGNDYIFQAGDVCGHNVVIATLPAGQEYGTGSAAALASQVKTFFPNLWFGLLVGVAAGLPRLSGVRQRDIRLGDVLVALPEGESAGLIAYDLGKETGDGFQLLRYGHVLASTETVVRAAIGSIKLHAPNDAQLFLPYYASMKLIEHADGTFVDPGQDEDKLYEFDEAGTERVVKRDRRPDAQRTRVWYGPIGSGEKLIRNASKRDELRDRYDVIGLETEAAGTMNRIPVGVIRGAYNYGDAHENTEWKPYAAAMAAAYAKGVLGQIRPKRSATSPPSATAYCDDPAFIQNLNFVGREEEISTIHHQLTEARNGNRQGRVCLWGPGGVGKTQLAAAYASQHEMDYSEIFKVCATDPEALQESFGNLAFKILARGGCGDDFKPEVPSEEADAHTRHYIMQRNISMVHHWFASHRTGKWLLVFDDVRLEVDINLYLPRSKTGSVILTSQSRAAGGHDFLLEVGTLTPDKAVSLLLKKAKLLGQEREDFRPRAAEVARLLGYLPLAVEHAGALISCKGVQYYWETLHSDRTNTLQQSDGTSIHQTSVFKTFQTSFGLLQGLNVYAARFLVFLSFLDNSVISSDLLFDDDDTPKKSLQHIGLFKGRAEFHDAVADLYELALIYRKYDGRKIFLSMHPLVHHMARVRLNLSNQTNWAANVAQYLYAPVFQPMDPSMQPTLADFRNVVQVLREAAELGMQSIADTRVLRLWVALSMLLARHYTQFHIHAKLEQFESYCKLAVAILEQGTEEYQLVVLVPIIQLMALASEYTTTEDTPRSVYKTFLSKLLKPAAARALEQSASSASSDVEQFGTFRYWWMPWPMTMRNILKRNSPEAHTYALFERMSHLCVGEKRWEEAILLAQFSELPATLWSSRPQIVPTPTQLVKAAFHASLGQRDMASYLDKLAQLVSNPGYPDHFAVTYDYGAILLKQGRYCEVESLMTSSLDRVFEKPKFSLATLEGTCYVWIVKALCLALVHQNRTAEAQDALLAAYSTVQSASEDDTLSLLHIQLLLISFNRKWGIHLASPVSEYDRSLSERFRRMYAANEMQLIKAEGVGMAAVLLAQGALEEAAAVSLKFVEASEAVLGASHALTLRARHLHHTAVSEMQREEENIRNGDFWPHFGCILFPRDCRTVNECKGGDGAGNDRAISWISEENRQPRTMLKKLHGLVADFAPFHLSSRTCWITSGLGVLFLLSHHRSVVLAACKRLMVK
ncbi:hypothetical protein LMH87_003525 [Akanthomyces muscarius]|uniref:Uncharacterized protein n=1 Tax=Akanthomyces muscarius TaxID=2231603 RepID=A0A9W8Q1Y9_AKAMU|nr:hypothetical protein LMH87_003525 [Akanthomyces muscarius]KAJ4144650.1 hypothetical protein LMH87_003525 [Akanthomyces muscarius]